jgi:hypothetical protein
MASLIPDVATFERRLEGMRALIRRYIEEAATQEWSMLAQRTATLKITPRALAEALPRFPCLRA